MLHSASGRHAEAELGRAGREGAEAASAPGAVCVMSARHCRAGSVAAQKPEGVTTLRSKQGRDCSPTSEPFSSYEVEELR